jgi:hypothetical protein
VLYLMYMASDVELPCAGALNPLRAHNAASRCATSLDTLFSGNSTSSGCSVPYSKLTWQSSSASASCLPCWWGKCSSSAASASLHPPAAACLYCNSKHSIVMADMQHPVRMCPMTPSPMVSCSAAAWGPYAYRRSCAEASEAAKAGLECSLQRSKLLQSRQLMHTSFAAAKAAAEAQLDSSRGQPGAEEGPRWPGLCSMSLGLAAMVLRRVPGYASLQPDPKQVWTLTAGGHVSSFVALQ